MHKLLLSGIIIWSVLSGCETNQLAPVEEIGETLTGGSRWSLVMAQNSRTGELADADSLAYSYAYKFNADSTFTKYNAEGDSATGYYQDFENPQWYRVLTFADGELMPANCSGNDERITREDEYLVVDTRPCDGPKYYYLNVISQ
jgi:hypothetical protein